MIQALVVGAVTGLALFLLIFALIPRRVGLARRIAAFDAGRTPAGHGAHHHGGTLAAVAQTLPGAAHSLIEHHGRCPRRAPKRGCHPHQVLLTPDLPMPCTGG